MNSLGLLVPPLLALSAPAHAGTITATLINSETIEVAGKGGDPQSAELEVPSDLRVRELTALRGATLQLIGEWDVDDSSWSENRPYFRLTSDMVGVHGKLALARPGSGRPDLLSWEHSRYPGAIELDLPDGAYRSDPPLFGEGWVFGRVVTGAGRMPKLLVTDLRMDAPALAAGSRSAAPGAAELVAAVDTLARALVPLPGGGWGLQVGTSVLRLDDTLGGVQSGQALPGAGQAR